MAMNKREKRLAAVTGGLLLVTVVVFFFVAGGGRSAADLQKDIEAKNQELAKVEAEIAKDAGAAASLAEWKKHALPWDKLKAQNDYQKWLREACKRVNFDYKKARTETPRSIFSADKEKEKKEVGRIHPFKIEHDATLDQLTQFLFEFYSAGYLHKITSLSISPVSSTEDEKLGKDDKGGKGEKTAKVSKENLKLTVKIDIEAIALKDADASDKSKLKPARPPLEKLDVYRKDPEGIVQRNLFAVYEPPKPPPVIAKRILPKVEPPKPDPPKPPEFDHATEAYVTAILLVDGKPQVWLDFKTLGELFKKFEGESFRSEKVKSIRGKIVKINARDVIVEIGGKRVRVDQDHSLRQGVPVP
jgi:hypothetical protein